VRIGSLEQPTGEHDGLEETLGQVVSIAMISSDGGNEGADRRVIPLGEFVQRRGRLVAVSGSFLEEIPGRQGEWLADWRTLLLPVFPGQRT
jgi:hypothetical protein